MENTIPVVTNKSAKYAYIDALRGIAILGVIMVHTSQYGLGLKYFAGALTSFVQHGARGVQLFFVASALTLWLSMSNRKQEAHPTRNFFIRRLFRIAPMYYLGIVGYAWWFMKLHEPLATPANVAANFVFLHGLSPYWINSLVPGGWSITVEMFFYCLAPWLFTRITTLDKAARFVLLALIINTIISVALARHPLVADQALWADFLFLYFPSQLPVFGCGILLYFILKHPEQRVEGRTLLAAAILWLANLGTGLPLLPEHFWYGVGFVVLALALSRYPTRLLANPFTQYVGKISFSLYLVHFAVLFALTRFGTADFVHATRMVMAIPNYVARFVVVLAISAGLATIFYNYVEVPGQNLGKRLIAWGESNPLRWYFFAPVLLLLPLFFIKLHKTVPPGGFVYVQIGDSITYGQENTPHHAPGDYAIRALATPAMLLKLGWPGETVRDFTAKHRQQLRDSLAAFPPGTRVILGIAYGANDLNAYPLTQAVADMLRTVCWATDTLHIKEVLLIPAMNRTDKFGYTRENDMTISHHFNESREQYSNALRAEIAKIPGVHMASEQDAPTMFSAASPLDTTRFADGAHPKDAGAKDLGEGTIAHGIASFEGIKLK